MALEKTPDYKKVIGTKIKEMRKNLGWTMEEVASKCNQEYSQYSGIERGVRLPRIDTLAKISQVFSVDITYWFGDQPLKSKRWLGEKRQDEIIELLKGKSPYFRQCVVNFIKELNRQFKKI